MNASPRCAIDPKPRVAQPPLRFIRTKVTIEPDAANREARLVLVDEFSEITSGKVLTDVRTTWIEWKNVVLGPGEYEVVLVVVDSLQHQTCTARERITVIE